MQTLQPLSNGLSYDLLPIALIVSHAHSVSEFLFLFITDERSDVISGGDPIKNFQHHIYSRLEFDQSEKLEYIT